MATLRYSERLMETLVLFLGTTVGTCLNPFLEIQPEGGDSPISLLALKPEKILEYRLQQSLNKDFWLHLEISKGDKNVPLI